MDDLTTLFSEVADALGIESVAIVEKDHYIVELLQLLKPLVFDTHQLVFAGGTALAKSGVALNRMSEDVDIKLVPKDAFQALSRTQRKNTRCIDSLEVRKKPGGHWIIRDLAGLDLVGLASL